MRAYNIQINVGDLDHELMGLSDLDRAAWLAGFQLGLHGFPCPAGHGASQHAGNAFGYACYKKTKRFMDQAAASGARSAVARRAKHGTAQPPKVPRQNAEVTSNEKPVTSNDQRGAGQSPAYNHQPSTPPVGLETGVTTPDPTPKPLCMKRFESQYEAKPTSFEQTAEGKAAAARRAAIRAERLKGSSETR